MEHKRLNLFAGHYGSGKTNLAVNYALALAAEGKRVCIGDLDIVNPYFRTADSATRLKAAGIDLICPQYANSNVDLPALPAEAYRLVQDTATYAIADIGGDDRGAYALGRYVPAILQEHNYRMIFVVNFCRPLTSTPEDALQVLREIETACGLGFTHIVNNTNLGPETTAQTLLDSLDYVNRLSALSGLPVLFHSAERRVANALEGKLDNVFSLQLQDKYFDLPTL